MRPELPKRPTKDVDKLAASWISRLLDCVEYAMNFPKGDGKTTRRSGDTLHALDQSRKVAQDATEGESYNGYFKVIKDGDDYKVVDGGNPDAAYCGYVRVGNARYPIAKATLTGISGDGCFYIETTYTSSYQISIKFASALPAALDGKDICLISDLIGDDIFQRLRNEHTIVRWV